MRLEDSSLLECDTLFFDQVVPNISMDYSALINLGLCVPEDESNRILWNIKTHSPNNTS